MPNNAEIQELTAFSLRLATAAGEAILPHFRKPLAIDNKLGKGWDPVTEGDRAAERVIRQLIESTYSTHGIIGEEFGVKQGTSAYTWVLDPIDGTRSFVIGIPTWATLIGLYRDGQPFIGVMSQPFVDDVYFGSAEASFHRRAGDTQRIRCATPKNSLNEALAGTTSPHLYKSPKQFDQLRNAVKMMRYGGDAYFFALLAAGHLDLALDAGLQSYDIAALLPIIRGAGGIVGTWDGKDETQGGNVLAASCQSLFDEAKALLNDRA